MRCVTAGLGLTVVLFMFLLIFAALPVHASTSIVFDSSGTPNPRSCNVGCTGLSWSHTVGVGSNGILIVGISDCCANGPTGPFPNPTASSVKFGTASLTPLGNHEDSAGNDKVELWSLMNPPSGTATITVTFGFPQFTAFSVLIGGSVSYFNVAGTGTVASADESRTPSMTASVTVNSNSGDLVVDTLATDTGLGSTTASTTSPQTQRWNSGSIANGVVNVVGAGSDQPASSPVTMTWSISQFSGWSLIAVPLIPTATTTTTTAPPIPEYPLGLPILAIFMIVGYTVIRRKTIANQS